MRVPFEEGCKLAAAISDARFVPLESQSHVFLPSEPAWAFLNDEIARFLGEPGPPARRAALHAGLTPAEIAVLVLVVEGLDSGAIAARLGKSEETVRNQVSALLGKLGVHSRAQAVVAALAEERGAAGT